MRVVLTYHSIDTSGSPISVAPDVFEEHARWFESRSVQLSSLDALLENQPQSTPSDSNEVAITFDDGFVNTDAPLRRLLDAGLPAAMFVVTAHVGGTNAWSGRGDVGIPVLPLLGWDALDALRSMGATLGAHTRTHVRLPSLSPTAAASEMDGCVGDLKRQLGLDTRYFAYPYGATSDRVVALAQSRFAAAFTTHFAPLDEHSTSATVPRLDMYYFRRPGAIRSLENRSFGARLRGIQLRRLVRHALP